MKTEVKHKYGTNTISAGPLSSNPTLAVLEQPFASANQWPYFFLSPPSLPSGSVKEWNLAGLSFVWQ